MFVRPVVDSTIFQIQTPFDKTGTVFLYLIKTKECIALIDTGASDSPSTALRPALATLGLELKDIDVILTSHAHLDHAGGHTEMKNISGARIYLHEKDLFMARSVEAQVEYHVGPLRALELPEEALKLRTEHVLHNAGTPFEPDEYLEDGMNVDLGGLSFRVVHIPGHAPGLCAFYLEKEGILFSADGVQGQGARPGSFPYIFDAAAYKKSLLKVIDISPRTLCLGHGYHGGSLTNNPIRTGDDVSAFLQESLDVTNAIYSAAKKVAKEKPATTPDWARKVLDELLFDIPQMRLRLTGMPLLAPPTLLSHINAFRAGDYPE
jgi:glyoxylase-like metal-dependent hydrolase (beta-lactamase superfamily II)